MSKFTKGDNQEAQNKIPFIVPSNIGQGFKWNDDTNKYDIDVSYYNDITSSGSGLETKDGKLKIKLSQTAGNLLQLKTDGLYYGVKAPPNLEHLYVDAALGQDQDPNKVKGAGSKSMPLRTLKYALELGVEGTRRYIYLKNRQEHICSAEAQVNPKSGYIIIKPYGEVIDTLLNKHHNDEQNVFNEISETTDAPVISFSEVRSSIYPYNVSNPDYTTFDLRCWNIIQPATSLEINGCILRNNLGYIINPMPNTKTDHISGVEMNRIYVSQGNVIRINRTKFEVNGTLRRNSNYSNPYFWRKRDEYRIIDGRQVSTCGFFTPSRNAVYSFTLAKLQDNMSCMIIGNNGWNESINAGITYSISGVYSEARQKEFAKLVYDPKIEIQNNVKLLLAPISDVPNSWFGLATLPPENAI